MHILAFDTSAAHCAVALLSSDEVVGSRLEPMLKGQAERLMVLCEEILAEGNTSWDQLDAIGVGVGPGNFTGIRISVSAARGLALSLGVAAIGVPIAEALAHGIQGPVVASIDARQDKIYAQLLGGGKTIDTYLLDDLPVAWRAMQPRCVGHRADEVAARLGGTIAEPKHMIATAIAQIAKTRAAAAQPRPAPLYVRPPDAAPPRDTAPAILAP